MQTKCSHLEAADSDWWRWQITEVYIYMSAWAREAGKQSLKGDPEPTDTDRRYTALFPNNNALAVNLILILTTKYGAHTAEQCVCYV